MNIETATAALRAYFDAQWNGLTPVLYDDVAGSAPSETFVRFNVRHVDADQMTIGAPGSNRHEQLGALTVQVFQPQGKASKDARAKAAAAADLFRGKSVSGIKFYRTTPREIGNDGRGFYQINVEARFRYSLFA